VRDARVYVKLIDRNARNRSQEEIQRDLRKRMEGVPGILSAIVEPGRMTGEKPVNVSIRGEDIPRLKKYAAELKKRSIKIPGIVDVEVTLEQDTPEFRITIDREKAMDMGVMTSDVVRAVGALVGGQAVTTYEDEERGRGECPGEVALGLRQDPAQVGKLRLAVGKNNGPRTLIPLENLVSYSMNPTPRRSTGGT